MMGASASTSINLRQDQCALSFCSEYLPVGRAGEKQHVECAVTLLPSSHDSNTTLLPTSHLCGDFCRAPGFWAWRGEHVPHGSAGFCHSSHLCSIVSSGDFTDIFFHSYLLQKNLDTGYKSIHL